MSGIARAGSCTPGRVAVLTSCSNARSVSRWSIISRLAYRRALTRMSLRKLRGISHVHGAICLMSLSDMERMTFLSDVENHNSLPGVVLLADGEVVMRYRLDVVDRLG